MSYLLVIKPEKLLRVELTDGTQLVVTEVRYSVAVDAAGNRRVAIELQWDPHCHRRAPWVPESPESPGPRVPPGDFLTWLRPVDVARSGRVV